MFWDYLPYSILLGDTQIYTWKHLPPQSQGNLDIQQQKIQGILYLMTAPAANARKLFNANWN